MSGVLYCYLQFTKQNPNAFGLFQQDLKDSYLPMFETHSKEKSEHSVNVWMPLLLGVCLFV